MTKKRALTIKERLESHILAVFEEVPLPGKKSNIGMALHNVFIWQVINKLAESRLKVAWKGVQPTYVPDDDTLRNKGEGDYIPVEAGPYSATVKITQGRQMFSRDLMIDNIAKKYSIPRHELEVLAELCYARSKRSVEKRVVEVS